MVSPYDLVRYPGLPIAATHPDRLATMGALLGVPVAPIQNARILEIGCCDGGNLLSIAFLLKGAECVGVDRTESDIVRAREAAANLQIPNARFHVMDLCDLPGDLGKFDYVIAHGVYSWVPPDVREKLMAVVRASLAPNGIAYISYNTLPGGHIRLALREMLQFHSRGVTDPEEKIRRTRDLLQMLEPGTVGIYKSTIQGLLKRPAYSLFHDELEDNYHPVYFHQFSEHANRYGLQYLSEAFYVHGRAEILGSEAAPLFNRLIAQFGADPIRRQQYLDFSHCRYFRASLVCHAGIKLAARFDPAHLRSFSFMAAPKEIGSDEGKPEFRGFGDTKIATDDPAICGIMRALIAISPRALPYDEIPGSTEDPDNVAGILHLLLCIGLVNIVTGSPAYAPVPGERPLASPLARRQAATGFPLTSLIHDAVDPLPERQARLIGLLDGTRSRADLLAELAPMEAAELDADLNSLAKLYVLLPEPAAPGSISGSIS